MLTLIDWVYSLIRALETPLCDHSGLDRIWPAIVPLRSPSQCILINSICSIQKTSVWKKGHYSSKWDDPYYSQSFPTSFEWPKICMRKIEIRDYAKWGLQDFIWMLDRNKKSPITGSGLSQIFVLTISWFSINPLLPQYNLLISNYNCISIISNWVATDLSPVPWPGKLSRCSVPLTMNMTARHNGSMADVSNPAACWRTIHSWTSNLTSTDIRFLPLNPFNSLKCWHCDRDQYPGLTLKAESY